jgi:hypothetical protein
VTETDELQPPDGSWITVRPISPEDRQRLAQGFEGWSQESRYSRFLAPKKRLAPAELAFLSEVDQREGARSRLRKPVGP